MERTPSTVYQMICNMRDFYAQDVAVRYYDEEKQSVCSVKYAQVYEDVCRCAAFLKQEIPGERPHVAILAKNSYYYIVHILAIILADMVAVPLSCQKSPNELCYETELTDVTAILHDGEYLEREPSFSECCKLPFVDINSFTSASPLIPAETADPDALALILFTSGTTARSKGVMLSQRNWFALSSEEIERHESIEKSLDISGRRMSTFIVLPLYHIGGLGSLWLLYCGQSINLCADPRRFYRDIAIMPSDFAVLVPVMLETFHKDIMRGKNRYGQLRAIHSVAAATGSQIVCDLRSKGFIILLSFGMTETCGYVTMNEALDDRYARSVGKPVNGVECKLAEDGELCIRGKSVMLGYYKDPAATAEAIDPEGWLHTGDLARIDEEGYIYLTGRKKNLIILSSGENINPEELEDLLYKNTSITEALAAEKDGKICARIYCPADAREAILKYVDELNRTLPMYKHISTVEFRTEPFERTSTGKIKRK